MSNSVHIVNLDGVVVMGGDWNYARTVTKVFENRVENRIYERDIYRGCLVFFTQKNGALRVLTDEGPRVVRNFIKHAPALGL